MKRLTALLLTGLLALALCACGPAAVPGGSQSGEPSAPEPEKQSYLCAQLDDSRLYAFPLDGGEKHLLEDVWFSGYDRRGDELLAAFPDGSVRVIDLASGEERTLVRLDEAPGFIRWCDSGFLFGYFTMTETRYWFYDFATGIQTRLTTLDEAYGVNVIGDTAYCIRYGLDGDRDVLIACDVTRDRERWRIDAEDIFSTQVQNGTLYARLRQENEKGGTEHILWRRVEPEDGTLTELFLPFDPDRYDLLYVGSGGCVVESREDSRCFFAGDGGVVPVDLGGEYDYFVVEDSRENTLLLATVRSHEYVYLQDDPGWCYERHMFLLSAYDGSVTEVDGLDQNQRLFAAGDFPTVDSSTARKPVTQGLYELFCLQSGAGGTMPLCSTTHQAWLNIADGTVDLALLAAPTPEEQAALKEHGVEVEMKLYGGDGLVFIGSKACGVTDLTLEQVRAIFRGEITNWAQLGGVDHKIRVLYRDEQSGSQRLFKNLLFRDREMPDFAALGFEELEAMSTIVRECLDDPYAIGYSIMTYLNDVYDHEELLSFSLEGYEATPENVRSGDYPLGTRGYVVIRASEGADSPARRLFNWFGCPVSDEILIRNGIVPLHEQE